eukprot:1162076-Pelagomonas_calceolata.AAC.4
MSVLAQVQRAVLAAEPGQVGAQISQSPPQLRWPLKPGQVCAQTRRGPSAALATEPGQVGVPKATEPACVEQQSEQQVHAEVACLVPKSRGLQGIARGPGFGADGGAGERDATTHGHRLLLCIPWAHVLQRERTGAAHH